jgi:polyhydroxybutyrate depolymerase
MTAWTRALGAVAMAALAVRAIACAPVARDVEARARTRTAETSHQGRTRSYRVHTPTPPRPSPPLVIVLHGGGGSGEQMEEVTGWSGIADREGLVVVYPDAVASAPRGFARFWNDGHCCGLAHWRGVDDVGFLRRLILEVGERHGVDRRRVFVVGWSNGASLAYAAGARLADLVAGIGPFAATMRGRGPMAAPIFDLPPPSRPVSVFAVHGTADDRVGYGGRQDADGIEIPFVQAQRFWAVAAGCRAEPTRRFEQSGFVRLDEHRACGPGNDVGITWVTLRGWGHDWPGPVYTDRLPQQHALRGWDVAERMWAFFARHGR